MPRTTTANARRSAPVTSIAILLCAAFASGCNEGGDTTCDTFRGQSSADQKKVITKLLEEKGQGTSPIAVTTAALSARAFCFTHNGSAKVKEIYGGG